MFHYIKKYIVRYRKNREKIRQDRIARNIQSKLKSCGADLEVFGEVNIVYADKLVIEDRCKLNDKVYINARSGIDIGNDVTISYGAQIISTGYNLEQWIRDNKRVHVEDTPVYIGDYCWIGAGAIILPGVRITGRYVVVGAGAVVTHDITEDKVVVAGSPAKIVRRLGEDSND